MNIIKLSHNESIDVSLETAERVNDAWNRWQEDKKNNPSSIMINSQNILMNTIRGVQFESPEDIKQYNLRDPEHKRIIKEFEKDIGNKKVKDYMIEKGAWMIDNKYKEGAVRDPKLYMEIIRKDSGLQELRHLREMAKKHEMKRLEKMSSENDFASEFKLPPETTEANENDLKQE